jgi:hypothetical protein
MPSGGANAVKHMGRLTCAYAPSLELADDGFMGKVELVTPPFRLKSFTAFFENQGSGQVDSPDLPPQGAGPSEYLHPFFLRPQKDRSCLKRLISRTASRPIHGALLARFTTEISPGLRQSSGHFWKEAARPTAKSAAGSSEYK